MNLEIPFDSINELIVRKRPVEETLEAITWQVMSNEEHALCRIWLLDKGDLCETCDLSPDCPDKDICLHLTASKGRNSQGKIDWTNVEGDFQRIPVGFRKIGRSAQKGESLLLNDLLTTKSSWIIRPHWIKKEKIKGFAAHPLKFQDDNLGVMALFSRRNISEESFEWLRVYAEQASIAIANARAFEEIEKLRQKLEDENEYLKEEIEEVRQHKFLIGESPVWKKILQQIELVGDSDATVLVTGESGTGKELIARALHEASPRKGKPLVKVNCAAITAELFESEFFGHVKGSFTGAFKERLGRFQVADGGTIFLDEIGEIPLALQGKLLRVLQEQQFERVGEDKTRSVDVRVIAATNKNLEEEVEKGNFRQDLFFRLSVFPISVPPLRERSEDIEPLTRHFLGRFASKNKIKTPEVTTSDISALKNYSYPGNVRELKNIIERAVILAQNNHLNFSMPEVINRTVFADEHNIPQPTENTILTYAELKDLECKNVMRALEKSNFKIYGKGGAAEILGLKPTTLISKIKALKIPMRPKFSEGERGDG